MVLLQTVVTLLLICYKAPSLECLEKITPSILRSPKLPLPVMAKSMEVSQMIFDTHCKHISHLGKKILPFLYQRQGSNQHL